VGLARNPGKEVTPSLGISFPASRSHHITLGEILSTNVTDSIPVDN
jgi:hypothetical protein